MVLGALLDSLSDIGAIAGILSIFGVGILILLLASQARELKAMREWIEAEPDRQAAAQQETIGEVQKRIAAARERRAAQAAAKAGGPPAPATKPAVPGAKVPAAAAAAAAAVPVATAATAAGSTPPPAPGSPSPPPPGAPAVPTAKSGEGDGKPAFAPLIPASGSVPPPEPAAGEPDDADDADDLTAEPAKPGQDTQLSEPLPAVAAASRSRETHYDDEDFELVDEEPGGGNRTLFAVGIAILVAGIVLLGVLLLGGGDEEPSQSAGAETEQTAGGGGGGDAAASTPGDAVDPSSVTVRVLNGTTVTGLAQDVTDLLADRGYGSVAPDTYTSNQSLSETTIAYREGYKDAATQVAKDLGLSTDAVQAMDAEIRVAATEQADVAVLVGTDLDNGTSPTTG